MCYPTETSNPVYSEGIIMPVASWKTELKEVAPNVFAYIQGGGPGIDNHSGNAACNHRPKRDTKGARKLPRTQRDCFDKLSMYEYHQ
jgi:hypothetical protein